MAAIAIGGNLGDVDRTFTRAVTRLESTPGVVILRRSTWHKTEPIGGPEGQPRYLNGVLLAETTLAPEALLAVLQGIETRLGRDRSVEVPNGPRPLDLDLLWHGDTVSETDALRLPHPRFEERLFVLEPLLEICPDHMLPGCGMSVRERVESLRAEGATA
jgi:2-amino-4-hydroxy-6-hydroxymethyldihydropteridine diphosphokinase